MLGNHLHVLLRNRPDIRDDWSDEEVVRRWWRVCPKRRDEDGLPAEIRPEELAAMLADHALVAEYRSRLGDISWFMRFLAEHIANRANEEEEISSRFWQGRFKMTRILDEAALLACAVYIDLNPIRAKLAETPETSVFTSVFERLKELRQEAKQSNERRQGSEQPDTASATGETSGGWLSPVTLIPDAEAGSAKPTQRASNQGYLEMSFAEYLEIVEWTGRQVRADKRGAIPANLAPIFERLKINGEAWVDAIQNFGRWFKSAAGRAESMAQEAVRRGQRYLHGTAHSNALFA